MIEPEFGSNRLHRDLLVSEARLQVWRFAFSKREVLLSPPLPLLRGIKMNDWEGFELGFWHPFRTACLGAAGKNLARKKRKNEENRVTLRSFNHSNLEVWYQELIAAKPPLSICILRNVEEGI